jgi:3',5'-cyclic AMP phosphodiesterase CpdA
VSVKIRLVHLSDIHFGCENVGAVEAAIGAVEAFAPDLTIVSGDITANGRLEEFAAARAWLDRLPQPQIATPGNHDVPYWSLPLRLASPFKRYGAFVGRPDKTAAYLPGLTVRCLNTARGVQLRTDWSKGAIDLAAVRTAAAEMRLATRALKVLVCHHPLIEPDDAAVTGGVHHGAEAARILAEAGVDLILTGHVHDPFALPVSGGQGRAYAVGAGTLSLRTRETPAGFSVIEADADTIRVSSLTWTGTEFHPAAVWTLARRAPPSPVRHFNNTFEMPDPVLMRRKPLFEL